MTLIRCHTVGRLRQQRGVQRPNPSIRRATGAKKSVSIFAQYLPESRRSAICSTASIPQAKRLRQNRLSRSALAADFAQLLADIAQKTGNIVVGGGVLVQGAKRGFGGVHIRGVQKP